MDTLESILTASAKDVAGASVRLENAFKLLGEITIDGTVGFDRERDLAGLDFSISFVQIRLRTIEELIRAQQKDCSLVQSSIRGVKTLLERAKETQAIAATFEDHVKATLGNGGLKPTTWQSFEIGSLQDGPSYSLSASYLTPIFEKSEDIILALKSLAPFRSTDTPNSSHLIERIAQTNQLITVESEKLTKAVKIAEQSASKTLDDLKAAESAKTFAEEHEASIKKIRDDLSAMEGETRSKKAGADDVIQSAASLKAQVDEYAAQFATFKLTLDDRNSTWAKGKIELETLISDLKVENKTIEETIKRAKSMLATATNAGLTAAQENRYEKLEKELNWAGGFTYLAFVILLASLSPLGAYIWANWDKTIVFTGSWEYVANVFVRSILLAPALLFVGFTTNRYRRIFRLKHEYGFRASLAGAVEGFKTQAPEHGEDIAAVAFYQLGRNPAETLDKEKTNPSWTEKPLAIFERFSDRFGKKLPPS